MDIKEKSYVFGLLVTDGNLTLLERNRGRVQLEVNEKDKDIWEDSCNDIIDSIQDAIDYEISEDNDTEENEDIVNHYLGDFYDLCDAVNIWLATM